MKDQIHQDFFEEIYNETYKDILKFIIVRCDDFNDVNDIIQETYIELFKVMQKKELEETRPFLFGIAKNKLKKYQSYTNKLKKIFFNKDVYELDFVDLFKSDYILEDEILYKLTEEEIWMYLNNKKPIITKIFYLYYTEDITLKNIASELSINESTVKTYLYRTLKELNSIFGKEEENHE